MICSNFSQNSEEPYPQTYPPRINAYGCDQGAMLTKIQASGVRMNGWLGQAVLGIVTGILTTALLWFAKFLWKSRMEPWLREIRYSGVQLEGKWHGHGEDPKEAWSTDIELFLNQSAHQLSGTFALEHKSPSNTYRLLHEVTGFIREGVVVLNFSPMDRRVIAYSTAMLKITGGGVGLVGRLTYRDTSTEEIVSEPVSLARAAAVT